MIDLANTANLICNARLSSNRPACYLSFGKDSMLMAHLIRRFDVPTAAFPKTHAFPMDVIYHRDPWFSHKHVFADEIIRSWSMEVHDFSPMNTGVKIKEDMLELVARYNFGSGTMDIPKNVCKPQDYPRRDFLCGLNDWMLRPKTFLMDYPWDTIFMGHRSADVDPFEGHVPLRDYETNVGGVRLIFPLRDWSDDDVWDYIEEHHVRVQESRYQNRREIDDKWANNDYTHACTACIDYRQADEVLCPKLNRMVKNRGNEILQLRPQPEYWDKKVEA